MSRKSLFVPLFVLSALLTQGPRVKAVDGVCPGWQSWMQVGYQGMVTDTPDNQRTAMRQLPTVNSNALLYLPDNYVFDVIGGPQCIDGFTWWQITTQGQIGWSAEGDSSKRYIQPTGRLNQNQGLGIQVSLVPTNLNICNPICNIAYNNWIEFYLPAYHFRVGSLRLHSSSRIGQVLALTARAYACPAQNVQGFVCVWMILNRFELSAINHLPVNLATLREKRTWWLTYERV
jgi:hypothetical protein